MFGIALKKLRKQHKLYQSDLADALHVSQATVAAWENGTRKPDLEMLARIAEYFGVTSDELLGIDRKENDKELWDLREQMRREPERRVLFSLAKSAKLDDVRRTIAVIDALRATNPDFYDGDDPA